MNHLALISPFRHPRPRGLLSCIPEHQSVCSVPDVTLECDEIIDNWDDIDSVNTSIYSLDNDEKISARYTSDFRESVLENSAICDGGLTPNSSAYLTLQRELPLLMQDSYVNSLLQLWHDANEQNLHLQKNSTETELGPVSQGSHESSQSEILCSISESNQTSEQSSNVSAEKVISGSRMAPDTESADPSPQVDVLNESSHVSSNGESSLLDGIYHLLPVSQSSSRASSPAEIENLSQSVMHLSFDNLRSISPRIERSPSPISSRSSSPRFLRSPSPFQVLNSSMLTAEMDDSADALVFYDDRYIFRSISPRDLNTDRRVPDLETDVQMDMSFSEEFVSFLGQGHRPQREQNSCQDQVVPECIEE